jgi:hypothetical protein
VCKQPERSLRVPGRITLRKPFFCALNAGSAQDRLDLLGFAPEEGSQELLKLIPECVPPHIVVRCHS